LTYQQEPLADSPRRDIMTTATENPLAKFYARMERINNTTSSIEVGTKFQMTTSSKWTSEKTKGIHTFTFVSEVTSVDSKGIEYKTIKVVSETGRPTFKNVSSCPTQGSALHVYILDGLADGSITLETK
jgi:hypothetical protein